MPALRRNHASGSEYGAVDSGRQLNWTLPPFTPLLLHFAIETPLLSVFAYSSASRHGHQNHKGREGGGVPVLCPYMVGGQKRRGRVDRDLGKDRGPEKENPREEEMRTQRRGAETQRQTQRKGEGHNPKKRETAAKRGGWRPAAGCQAPRERGTDTQSWRQTGAPQRQRTKEGTGSGAPEPDRAENPPSGCTTPSSRSPGRPSDKAGSRERPVSERESFPRSGARHCPWGQPGGRRPGPTCPVSLPGCTGPPEPRQPHEQGN